MIQPDPMDAPRGFQTQETHSSYRLVDQCSLDKAVARICGVISYARHQGLRRLLVDTTRWTGHPRLNTLERYDMAAAFSQASRAVVKLAMVTRPELIDTEKFGVTVATNRGMTVDVFDSETAALAWLLAPDPR